MQELQTEDGKAKRRPILLILDDFERALSDPTGWQGHSVKADLSPGTAELLRAFANSVRQSHPLITCRVKFTRVADGRDAAARAEFVSLPDMPRSDLSRQALRLAHQLAEAIAKVGTRMPPEEVETLKRSLVNVAPLVFGSPRLMTFAAQMQSKSATELDGFCRAAEEYRVKGETSHQELVDELERIAIDRLLGLLSTDERELLRRSCLFSTAN